MHNQVQVSDIVEQWRAPQFAMGRFELLRRMRQEEFREHAEGVVRSLRLIATTRLHPIWTADPEDDNSRDRWLGFIQTIRHMEESLRGPSMRVFVRGVAQHAPDLSAELEEAVREAVETLQHMRAWLSAMMVGGYDDEELGIDILPERPECKPGPSVPVRWG